MITINSQEAGNHHEIVKYLSDNDCKYEVTPLECGDFIVDGLEEGLLIERKSISDFYGSLIDGRLFDQAKWMAENKNKGYTPLEIIELNKLGGLVFDPKTKKRKYVETWVFKENEARMYSAEVGLAKFGIGLVLTTDTLGCYDEQTEVLTENGWKLFSDVNYEDKICTFNQHNGMLEYQIPTNIVVYSHHKELVHIENSSISLAVTLDHNIFGMTSWNHRKKINKYNLIKAKDLPSSFFCPRTGNWDGIEKESFVLEKYKTKNEQGIYFKPEVKIDMNKWLEFLGLWLSEGWTDKNGIGIAQSKPKTKKEVERIVSLLPFKWRRTKPEHICIYSVQLSNYLKQFGTATHKFVPSYVKTLSKKQISLFLNAYALGDASHDKYGGRTFWTSSKQMADDLQELIIKIGGVANLYQIPSRQSKIGNRIITPTVNFCYRVHQRSGRLLANIVYKKHLKIKSYSGLVYCVEVPNHILMIRRQGKPILCGNTARFLRQQNERLGEPKVRKSYPERGGFRKSMTLEERKLYLVEAFGLEIGKALVRDYPNIAAMTHEMGYGQLIRKEMTSETLINNIANIKLGSGRRVGPAKAKQIYEVCFT